MLKIISFKKVKSLSSFYARGRVWVKYGKILAINTSGEQGKFKVKDKVYKLF